MIQLDPNQYSTAGLFRDLGRTFLAALAVIQRASSGAITAGDPAQPHLALLEAHRKYYLAGSPDDPRTVQGLRD